MSRGPVAATKGGTLLNLRVAPGARRTGIVGPYGEGAIKVRVAAPPVDGKADAEVGRLLALLVHGREPAEVRSALDSHLA